ncbi:MAG: 2-amino-4-hydroxy-6-hydroxymethyldihydropteridine diphosphokinase [Flavobacteriaceae bacterium]|jgi:2-amino-4-hydroxy-6-hydroxymethyldihydropteridine diphosphokinase|nr:2-amino-4-hydroxy-6-hydroxymethyldihydropteridine diphosphokinase [Flavobacteriaceae bacterium]
MSQNKISLLLGSNIFDRKKNLETASELIISKIGKIERSSKIIETVPEGFQSDHNFLNQVIEIRSEFSPMKVLKLAKEIEKAMGRIYIETSQAYQDRIIDIDLLTFNSINFESKELSLPHHQVNSRKFVKKLMN